MEIQYQNHDISHLSRFSVRKSENERLLDDACTMLSELLPPFGCMASKMSTVGKIAEGTEMPSPIKDSTHSEEVDTNISIELIKEDDAEEVLKLLKKFFFKDEPLNTFVNLGECKELEKYSTKSLHEHCSFKAVNSRGEIIGVTLNGLVLKPSETDEPPAKLADGCEHPKFRKIMAMMDYIDEHFNIFELYQDVDRLLDVKIMSVDSRYRGFGIAGKLTDRTMQYVKENNIKLVQVLCSSHFSARVMEKLNFEEVYQLPYRDYLVNGEQVFDPEKPHSALKILVKKMP
ncbi:arylalkylamine N-acetyltransferase 1 isoform X1 [Toxorhynchites rutilus septentrionalis]|uniref:arylalkylamine N-acetyltransferase 1 isoform X1 n=2 Tax=Toxorhynchites rutilus septentrionalis TaxID=329112 RepID=UPI0024789A91|nr:arylalkylamine N-acetyltransferase 1 isoform X1 [Toxorhynchites rutilus septentrionalis]XP_055636418.1 arylalkylamine N-acetyltransferase 1 isoform X1 [Toxorhynchites rutilus septentrionalis]